MRLIDADALINTLDAEKDRLAKAKENRYAAQIICDLERVRTAPTIEAEPIRHGKWKKVSDKAPKYSCTECHHLYNNKEYKYCPFCGAKMDGNENEG